MLLPDAAARGDVVGQYRRVVADAGQERGTHSRQPLQAEEIEPGYFGDAAAVKGLASRIEHGNFNPAEVDAVAGGPDHGRNAGGVEVETPERRSDARRI